MASIFFLANKAFQAVIGLPFKNKTTEIFRLSFIILRLLNFTELPRLSLVIF